MSETNYMTTCCGLRFIGLNHSPFQYDASMDTNLCRNCQATISGTTAPYHIVIRERGTISWDRPRDERGRFTPRGTVTARAVTERDVAMTHIEAMQRLANPPLQYSVPEIFNERQRGRISTTDYTIYGVRIEVADQLGDVTLSGAFETRNNTNDMLRGIRRLFGYQDRHTGGRRLVVSPRQFDALISSGELALQRSADDTREMSYGGTRITASETLSRFAQELADVIAPTENTVDDALLAAFTPAARSWFSAGVPAPEEPKEETQEYINPWLD